MSKRLAALLFVILAVLFLIVNRAAYKGYFQDDEIDNLSWTRFLGATEYIKDAATPLYFTNNFRPAGHFYFYAAEKLFGLNFPPYVAVIQAIHLVNVWLLWMLARRLGSPTVAAVAACLFFAFHMALFDVFWKPMYVFDLLCAAFCLTSLLLYTHQRWVLSFVAFWLAYKAKELAVMLPVVLGLYEFWFGKRRWKPLVPFFLGSLSFGLQGLLLNPNKDNDYTFRFTAAALAKTSPFYAGRVFLAPYLGFFLPLAALTARNRRTWFGLALMAVFFFPLLFLPGRMFSAYCYVPFLGLAVALAGAAENLHPAALALFFVLWLPADYRELRARRSETLARDAGIKTWMTTAGAWLKTAPPVDAFVYSGAPEGFNFWGIEGALKYFTGKTELNAHSIDDPQSAALLRSSKTAVLTWKPETGKLDIHPGGR
jgi:hypothetical protein